jgi:arginine utilization regulatory protein
MILNDSAIVILDALAAMGNYVEVADKNGYYVYCSKNCTYDAVSSDCLVGKHITVAFDLTEESSVLLDTLRTGRPQRDIFLRYVSRLTGREHYWLYNAFPIIIDGHVEGAVALYRTVDGIRSVMQNSHGALPCTKCNQGNICKTHKGIFSFEDIIFTSVEMAHTVELAKRVAKRDSSVLLTGETGTGKELFAQSIHSYSLKSDKPFVAVNCAAIPDNLLESILFGVSKGAYTGAIEKRGLFEESSEGTVYLDEIQALSLEMQAKLLRVLETKKIRKVGGDREFTINSRVISSINVNPLESIEKGTLKPDLFYRIAVVPIEIPPLRMRKNDIPLLAKSFIYGFTQKLGLSATSYSPQVQALFEQYQWPGNVRELKHALEYAVNVINEEEPIIQIDHLPPQFHQRQGNLIEITNRQKHTIGNYKEMRQQALKEFSTKFNKEFLTQALEQFNGNIAKTAREINVSRQHLYELINKYDIPQFPFQ